jgi:signal transduction histidine kinase
MRIDELRPLPLFDGFTDDQLTALIDAGDEVAFAPGQVLFVESTPAEYWWVLLEGSVELTRHVGREDVPVAALATPGQWAGGLRAWDPNGVYMATGHTVSQGRVLRVASDRLLALARIWIPFGIHMIRGLMQTVRHVESTARQRESLVALGTLAAGLAHEINNPAAAAIRAVDSLQACVDDLAEALRRLAVASITAEEFVALDELRRGVVPPTSPPDALALADAEDDISGWLSRHRIDRDWVIAPPLAAAGLDPAWCERVAGALPDAALGPGLEWIAASLSTGGLLAELKDSTGRISELVAAVRSYSQMDRASLQSEIDVTEGIDNTLIMLTPRLKGGVNVIKQYSPERPRIEAAPGELNQVWTNLIDNAVDAMDGSGTLRISVRPDGDRIVVDVADTGSGMTPEVVERIFEPFFTTKDVGRGTGLGLDISRRIVVERHSGEITVDSSPAGTVFHVALPKRHASR